MNLQIGQCHKSFSLLAFLLLTSINFLNANPAKCQETTPLLSGTVEVSIAEGTIKCDLLLSNIPKIEDYLIFINTGMNIAYIRDSADSRSYYYNRIYKDSLSDESFAYYLPSKEKKFLPRSLRFRYVGKYPVISDTTRAYETGDWKGNIAFNGYSLRADGRQCAWYPVLYDVQKDKRFYSVRCNLEIKCKDCSTIYLNGGKPVNSSQLSVKNDEPLELALYAGNFTSYKIGKTHFLNPDISESQMQRFSKITEDIQSYYEAHLKVPYTSAITFVQTTPVSKKNAWKFVSFPTIFNVGRGQYGLIGLFENNGDRFKPFLAHELGHYYFGYYKKFNTELGDVLSEGFAEYLSMTALRGIFSDSLYTASIQKKITKLADFKPVQFSKIKNEEGYLNRELYVYNYAPLVFTAIEHELGEKTMWAWLRTLITSDKELTNYDLLVTTLRGVAPNAATDKVIERYFVSDSSLGNVITNIEAGKH